jgi:hypothetical protein
VAGEDFIDFSSGDWRSDHAYAQRAGKEVWSYPEPTEWQCDPPEFVWAPKSALVPSSAMIDEACLSQGTIAPPLGQTWYTLFAADRAVQETYLLRAVARATGTPLYRSATEHIVKQIFYRFGADGYRLAMAMREAEVATP